MKASGARISAAGSRYVRGRLGFCLRSAPSATGAPAYMNTEALVTMLTNFAQLGNGSRNRTPTRVATSTPNTGTREALTRSKAVGTNPLRLRPNDSRADAVSYISPVPPGETTASILSTVASHEMPAMLTRVKNGPALSAVTVGLVLVGPRFVHPCWEVSRLGFRAPMKATWRRM